VVSGTLPAEELARRCAEAMWGADAASRALGIDLRHVGPGQARVSMTVRGDMVNGHGLCHGGLVATLADSAFALACNSRGTVTVAAGFTIDLLEPARLGDVLVAEAREVALRGRSGLYDVTVRREAADGAAAGPTEPATEPLFEDVIAEFRGRSRSLGRPILEDA
jgi:acyl-CoA thioesterase